MNPDRRADQRPRLAIGLRVLDVPSVPATAVHDCLSRLPVRHDVETLGGALLWLPRLGVTVLPHELVTGGWVCTLVAVDAAPPGRLPSGVFVVADLELRTAIATRCPWFPTADLTVEEFGDAWRVRLAVRGGTLRVGSALIAAADPDTLTVDVADTRVLSQAGCRSVTGFAQACRRLRELGLLEALFDDEAAPSAGVGPCRYGLVLPPASVDWARS